jgi:hypothetical protein
VNVNPAGRPVAPNASLGVPEVETLKENTFPTVAVAVAALVNAGA